MCITSPCVFLGSLSRADVHGRRGTPVPQSQAALCSSLLELQDSPLPLTLFGFRIIPRCSLEQHTLLCVDSIKFFQQSILVVLSLSHI